MSDLGRILHLLRNTPVREIMRALERDGFFLYRYTRTGGAAYRHNDGRRTFIHYHSGGTVLTRKTLSNVIRAVKWTEADLRRLGLI